MGIRYSLNGRELGERSEAFFALRVGTGRHNDIVIASGSPGVHENHCTIVSTGSTFRLEMRPEHLVYVDGALGECGGQLFQKHVKECELQLGSANAKVQLTRTGDNIEPEKVFFRGRPRRNRDRLKEHRRLFQLAFLAILVLLIAGGGGFYAAMEADRAQKASIGILQAAQLSEKERKAAQASVLEMGLSVTLDNGAKRFVSVGTGWVLLHNEKKSLVTNIHVSKTINSCVLQPNECDGIPKLRDGTTPEIAVRLNGAQDWISFTEFSECGIARNCWSQEVRHKHYAEFGTRLKRAGMADIENVYDVAVFPLGYNGEGSVPSDGYLDQIEGLRLSDRPAHVGDFAAMLGYPTEGDDKAISSSSSLYRTVYIGRVTSPFGFAAADSDIADHVVLTGGAAVGGDSGGPVINGDSEVIAMTFAGYFAEGKTSTGARQPDGSARVDALSAELIRETVTRAFVEGRPGFWDSEISSLDGGSFKQAVIENRWISECIPGVLGPAMVAASIDFDAEKFAPIVETEGSSRFEIGEYLGEISGIGPTWYSKGTVDIDFRTFAPGNLDGTHKLLVIAKIERSATDTLPPSLIMRLEHPLTRKTSESWDLVSFEQYADMNIAIDSDPEVSIPFEVKSTNQTTVEFEVRRFDCSVGGDNLVMDRQLRNRVALEGDQP